MTVLAMLFALLGLAAPAAPQVSGGSITGVLHVWGVATPGRCVYVWPVAAWPVGAPEPGPLVSKCLAAGEYNFTIDGLPAGDYILRFEGVDALPSYYPAYDPTQRTVSRDGAWPVSVSDGNLRHVGEAQLAPKPAPAVVVSVDPPAPQVGQQVTITATVTAAPVDSKKATREVRSVSGGTLTLTTCPS